MNFKKRQPFEKSSERKKSAEAKENIIQKGKKQKLVGRKKNKKKRMNEYQKCKTNEK